MILLIFILIYILSVIGLLLSIYITDTHCKTIGDIFDESKLFMYIPLVNTVSLIPMVLGIIIDIVIKSWDKIRNIKLR
jgi:hypothetical protein